MRNTFSCLLGIAIIFSSCSGQKQSSPKTYYNEDFKWTIIIPAKLDTISAEKWQQMQGRGTEAMEKTVGEKIENRTTTLFALKYDQSNYFESNYQPYDESTDGDYSETSKIVNDVLYQTFASQMPNAKLDSMSSTTTIDGLTFHTFTIEVTLSGNKVMKAAMYNRLFGKKDLTVSIVTMSKEKEKELLNAWTNSKFGK